MRPELLAAIIVACAGSVCEASDGEKWQPDLNSLSVGAQWRLDMVASFDLVSYARHDRQKKPSSIWLEGTVSRLTRDEITLRWVSWMQLIDATHGFGGAVLTQEVVVPKSWVRRAQLLTAEERTGLANALAEEKARRSAPPNPPSVLEAIIHAFLGSAPKRACAEEEAREGEKWVIDEIRRNMEHPKRGG